MPIKVFISHSSVDADIAEALIKLFKKSLNLPSSVIRCTSVDRYRLPGGASTTDTLRKEVEESEIFIGLLINTIIQSTYVLFELGARWGSGKMLLPILAAGATPRILRAPLNDYNALDCNNESQVYQILEDLSRKLNLELERPNTYRGQLEEVVKASMTRGEASVEFNIIIDTLVVGQAHDGQGGRATSVLMPCSIVNLSSKHVIVDNYELFYNISGQTGNLSLSPVPEGADFSSDHIDLRIKNPQKHDLTKRVDSMAPGQGISGVLMFFGSPELYDLFGSAMRSGEKRADEFLSMSVLDINGVRYQTKVVSPTNKRIGIFNRLGFSARNL